MCKVCKTFKGSASLSLLVLRVTVGAVFLAHGIQKFQGGVDGVAGFFDKVGIPMASLMAWVVTVVETLGGALLILGLATQLSAALLAFVMIVAVVMVKAGKGFISGYELDVALFASCVALMLQGAGKYSIDSKVCGSGCEGCAGCEGSECKDGKCC
jgi:uncharacterized membrane protein YphA (DoxX/SURF4 family)